jgi:hypothetical protein
VVSFLITPNVTNAALLNSALAKFHPFHIILQVFAAPELNQRHHCGRSPLRARRLHPG